MFGPIEGGFKNLSLQTPMAPKQSAGKKGKAVLRDVEPADLESRRAAIRDLLSSVAGPQLPPDELLRRKIEIRDIVSASHRYKLPSEISPDAFESIDSKQGRRDPSEWTRPEDLAGTLMQRGTHNEILFELLYEFYRPEQRAILFWQKLARRMDAEFIKYDHPEEDLVPNVEQIADNLRLLESAFIRDQSERAPPGTMSPGGELNTAYTSLLGAFIDGLTKVCARRSDQSSPGPTHGSSVGPGPVSLYHNLIANPPAMQEPFMIDLLEHIIGTEPQRLSGFRSKLEDLLALLAELEPPAEYMARLVRVLESLPVKTPSSREASSFRRLEPKPEDDDDDDNESGPAPGPARPSRAAPPTGTKRPAVQAPGRRGKQKRGTR